MEIKISHSWLMEHLDTKATPRQIANCLSLCGPSIDKLEKINSDWVYSIEVTTNRVDMANVRGIAQEATAILPRFGIKARLKPLKPYNTKTITKSLPLKVKADPSYLYRTIGVVFDNATNWESPKWLRERLELSGIRSLNAPVDITNYTMMEIGHPMHVFDYDKIKNANIIITLSKKGEKIISLDDKEYTLPGGDIIFKSVDGEIIDLPGIIGTKNSVVSKSTKRFLIFIDNQDPLKIRKTSIGLGIRTVAATINEKGVDPNLGMSAIYRGSYLFEEVCKAKRVSDFHDNYLVKRSPTRVKLTKGFIDNHLGVTLTKSEISTILKSLNFENSWASDSLNIVIPTARTLDVSIPEDIIEEIARIYGYHKIPSELMKGAIPADQRDNIFDFENKLKLTLSSLGGNEVYTLSLVSKVDTGKASLKLKNPIGSDTEYLRTSLMRSLIKATESNSGEELPYHLYEIANIYKPISNKLPEEIVMLAGILPNYYFRNAKGVIETFLDKLNIKASFAGIDINGFLPSRHLSIKIDGKVIGDFGILENGYIYYQFPVNLLYKYYTKYPHFKPIPKYPSQVEDITFSFPEKTRVGDVIDNIKTLDKHIVKVELVDTYKEYYTIRIWYQDPNKTLINSEVEKIRKEIIAKVKTKYGGIQKIK